MARLKPPFATTAALTAAVVQERDFAYDTTLKRFVMGDGVLPAGKPLAFKSEVDTLPSGSVVSAGLVTPTGASAARTLATLFSDAGLPWVNVKDFGALGDCVYNSSGVMTSGTDDTAAIQLAIDYIEATAQGRGIVFLPRGWYKITAKLRIKKGVLLMGAGSGHVHDSVSAVNVAIPDAATALIWVNASGDKMIHMEPAVTNGRRISGGGVVGIALYGNEQATHGVYARSVHGAEFKFFFQHVTGAGMYLGVVPAADSIVGEARDSQYNRIDISGRNTAANGGNLLVLDGDSGANASKNHIRLAPGLYLDDDAIDLINCDNNTFEEVYLFRFTGGTARALRSRGGATAAESSRANDFWKFSSSKADGSDPEIKIEGFADATVPSVDTLMHLDTENDTPEPTVGAGASVLFSTQETGDGYGPGRTQLIINGDFALNQLNAASCTDKTAGFDGGVVLTQSAAVTLSSVSAPENGQAQCLRITQSDAGAQRFGYLFVIPSEETVPLRGKGVAFAIRGRLSTAANVRVSISEWTGTADAAAADLVADWTSSTYTTAGFFTSTTHNVLATHSTAMSAATWRDLAGAQARGGITATVGASANNLLVFVWVEATAAQNVTLDLGRARLVAGYMPTLNVREDRARMIARAERIVEKSYNLTTAPGSSSTVGAAAFAARAADQADRVHVPFRVRKLGTPTITVYSTTGASGNIRNLSAGSDLTASAAVVGETGFAAFPTANTTSASSYAFHWTATRYPWA